MIFFNDSCWQGSGCPLARSIVTTFYHTFFISFFSPKKNDKVRVMILHVAVICYNAHITWPCWLYCAYKGFSRQFLTSFYLILFYILVQQFCTVLPNNIFEVCSAYYTHNFENVIFKISQFWNCKTKNYL